MAFRAGLGAGVQASPADQRGGVAATFFIVAYIALSIPVVGIGLAVRAFGLATAGMAFAGGVALLAMLSLATLLRRRRAMTPSRDPTIKAKSLLFALIKLMIINISLTLQILAEAR